MANYIVYADCAKFESNSRNAKKHLFDMNARTVDVYRITREGEEVLVSSAKIDKTRNIVFFGAVR